MDSFTSLCFSRIVVLTYTLPHFLFVAQCTPTHCIRSAFSRIVCKTISTLASQYPSVSKALSMETTASVSDTPSIEGLYQLLNNL